ncbi:hypothetical protein FRC17_010687 [Serendipita sp. 399]|nr:hypothetical protein FRC17_010687 [Serendipita sp. 399]
MTVFTRFNSRFMISKSNTRMLQANSVSEAEGNSGLATPQGRQSPLDNRAFFRNQTSKICELVSSNAKEIDALTLWIKNHQNSLNLSGRAENDLKLMTLGLIAIHSLRSEQLNRYIAAHRALTVTMTAPEVSLASLPLRLGTLTLEDNESNRELKLDTLQDRVQETVGELDRRHQWLLALRQRLQTKNYVSSQEIHHIDGLQKCVATLRAKLGQRYPAIGIGRGLPDDILFLVFSICISEEIEERRKDIKTRRSRAILTLSSVCSGWRLLILASPTLWSYIPLPHSSTRRVYSSAARRLEQHIKSTRPGGHIILDCPFERGRGDTVRCFSEYISHRSARFDSLSSIEIMSKARLRWNIDCFWKADTVTFVHNLTLYVVWGHWPGLQRALQGLINLRYLKLVGIEEGAMDVMDAKTMDPVLLPKLTHFVGTFGLHPTLLQDCIRVPSLHHIGVCGIYAYDSESRVVKTWSSLIDHLKTRNMITSLGFSESISTKQTLSQFVPILQQFSTVEAIELEGRFMLPVIDYLKEDRNFAPMLCSLVLRGTDVGGDLIQSLVESRSKPIMTSTNRVSIPACGIKNVTFDHCTSITRASCEELRELIEELRELIEELNIYC